MSCAGTGDAAGDNPALLRNKPLQFLLILVIDVEFFIIAEAAGSTFS